MTVRGAGNVTFFLAACAFAAYAWVRSLVHQIQGARRTTPDEHWWLRMNSFDPLIHPALWPPDARKYWRRHLLWSAIFVGTILFTFLVGRLAGWPNE